MTGCTCTEPGVCERHGVKKDARRVKLCQTNPAIRALWDQGIGPGQRPLERPDPTREPKELPPAMPPTREQVVSFLKAMAQWAGDGFRVVDGDEFERRVEICTNCEPYFNARSGRCRVCGCVGKLKARGKVWTCPKGFWDE